MKKSVLFILAAGILWGCMGLFVRVLESFGFSALQTVSIRLVISAAAFFITGTIKGKDCLKIKLRDVPLLFCTGFFGIMLMAVTYFLSITYSSLSVAAILLYTAPAFVMVASLFLFREKFGKIKCFALISALTGILLVSGILDGNANLTAAGIIFGLLSGITYGSYSIFGTYALKKYDSYTVSAWAFAFAALSSLPFADIPDIISKISLSPSPLKTALISLGMGIFTAFLPFMLYTAGLSKIGASKAVIIASVEPLTATVIGFIVYNEKPTVLSASGIILILVSVVLAASDNSSGEKEMKTNQT